MFAPKLRAKAVANPRDGIGHARSMLPVNHSGNRSIEETQWLRHSNGHQATSGPVAVHDRNQRSGQPGQENFDAFPPAARALRNFAGIPVFSPRQDGPFDSRSSVPTFFMPGAMQNERRPSRMLRDMRGDGSDDVMLTDQHDGGSRVAHPSNKIEDALGLRDAKRRGRLIHEDHARRPHRGARHRDTLPLAA